MLLAYGKDSAFPLRTRHCIIVAYMEFQSIQNALNLLGQAPPPPPPPPETLSGRVEPKLEIAWGSFHQGFWSGVGALFGPSAPKDAVNASAFRDSWVEGQVPKRAVVAAALWHAAILLLPFSLFSAMPRRNPLLPNVELSWQGPIDDLPLLEIARAKPEADPVSKPKSAKAKPEDPPPEAGDPVTPRRLILTDAVQPTHPR